MTILVEGYNVPNYFESKCILSYPIGKT